MHPMQPDCQDHPPSPSDTPDDLGSIGTQVEEALSPEALASLAKAWGRPDPAAAPRRAALLTAILLLPMLYIQWPQRLLPSPWLGFLTVPSGLLPAPLPPYWHAATSLGGQLLGVEAAYCAVMLALVGVLLVASGAGAIAALLHSMASQRFDGRRNDLSAILAGALAGIATYLSLRAQEAWFSGGPEALTAAMAVWGVYLYLRHYDKPRLPTGMLSAALLIGATCVEQPYFLLLAALCLLHTVLFAVDDSRLLRRLGALALVFGFALAVPTLELIRGGLPPRAWLDHVLHLTYPDFSFQPRAFRLDTPAAYYEIGLALPALYLALLGLRLQRLIRADLGFLLVASVLIGAGMPFVANPPRQTLIPCDVSAPGFVALALLLAMASPAAAILVSRRAISAGVSIAIIAIVSIAQFTANRTDPAADPSPVYAALLGHSHAAGDIRSSGADGVIIAGNLEIASTLWLAQQEFGLGADAHIVPSSWLVEHPGRVAAQKILGPHASLDTDFPDRSAFGRWQRALPFIAESLKEAPPQAFESLLEPFALYDLVAQLSVRQQVTFVGVDFPWVTARAAPDGLRLKFPVNDDRTGEDFPHLINLNSPVLKRLDAALQLPWIHSMQARGKYADDSAAGDAYARIAREIDGGDDKILDTMAGDINLLWRQERFYLLRKVYQQLAARFDRNPEALYQLAAANAQLGRWEESRESLGQWIALQDQPLWESGERLSSDARFDLYRRWVVMH